MPVQVQKTPNPNALKFILPQRHFDRPLNISTMEEAAQHPLAAQLLGMGTIYNVFMVQDFITVNKLPHVPWEGLEEEIVRIVARYFGLEEAMRQ
jgi:hypothetical protein